MKSTNTSRETSIKSSLFTRKRLMLAGSAIVVLAVLATGTTLLVKQLTKPDTISSAKLVEKNPAVVGKYRYVNACQVLPSDKYKQALNYEQTDNSSVESTYAEGSRSKLWQKTSECTTNFGNTTLDIGGGKTVPSDVASLFLTLTQYQDTKTPELLFSGTKSLHGQDVDLSPLGSDSTITADDFGLSTQAGISVANNLGRVGEFEFAYRNMTVSVVMSDLAGTAEGKDKAITPEYTQQVITKLVPILKSSIDNAQLSQAPVESNDIGKRISGGTSATIIYPCDYFTGVDFKTITGSEDDSMHVKSSLYTDPIADAKEAGDKQSKSGRGSVDCRRTGYVSTAQPVPDPNAASDPKAALVAEDSYDEIQYPIIDEKITYYKDSAEAIAGAKFKTSANKQNFPDATTTEVTGLGDYAAFSQYTFSNETLNISSGAASPKEYHLYVAKGSYVIDIDVYYTSGKVNVIKHGTDAQYKQAAQLIVDKLPS